ncbi:MAG: MBL fold metallo-hydrolase [Blautia sp.]|nr:MBL fold metallo-hydrolase [Blautia sp.]
MFIYSVAISEYKHWEETHCYLLCGTEDAILIDTGLGVASIKNIVDSLTLLPVTAVTTHVHWDHIGGHKYFGDIAVHEAEKEWLSVRFPIPLQAVKLMVIHTPGHSPGHCCFYEPDRKDPQLFFHSVRKIQNLSINRILPGHHQLDISVDMIGRIESGFRKLADEGKLKQGNGVFDFEGFQIHI